MTDELRSMAAGGRWRRWLAAVAAVAMLWAGPGPAFADDEPPSDDNAAVAINTTDGSTLFEFAFSVIQVSGDVVDATNTALAYSSCVECKTVAVAIQVVFITGDASTVVPTNVAAAVNENCTACVTMASAYQFVLTTDGPVEFTKEGRKRLKDLHRELRDLEDRVEELTVDEIRVELDGIVAELTDILENELVPAKRDRDRDDDDDDDGRDEDEDVEVSPGAEGSPSPSPSETGPTGTPSPEPTPSESPTETETP